MAGTTTKAYCTAPWNGLTIREDGHVRTCCNGQVSLGNLNTTPIQAIEQSPVLMALREQMSNGDPNQENCRLCINAEANGGDSLKQYYNRTYPDVDGMALRFIDIRWNNTCNLACQYCDPQFSSTWSDRLNATKIKPVKEYQDDLLAWMLTRADQVREIMLVGGEPMLMKQNYALLRQLPTDTRISIITNLSYDLSTLPCLADLTRRPPENVIWNISLENTGPKFEYVRNGARWSQIEKNIKFINQMWPENASLNMVYSMFNAFDIDRDIVEFHNMGIKKFNLFNILNNQEMNVFNMPKPIQAMARVHLEQAIVNHRNHLHPEDQNLYPMHGADQLLATLEQTDGAVTQTEFNAKLQTYDQWTAQTFESLWPNVVNLVKTHCKSTTNNV
jgi:organic radical activating enzyme